MTIENCKLKIAGACVLVFSHSFLFAAPFTINDIDFWVGDGANRAALVIDWVDDSSEPPALAWGFRWDGAATGADMLAAIVAEDERLFAKLGGAPENPVAVYGLGYDANDNGQFALDDATQFNTDGVVYTGPADAADAVDANDYYAEGWFASGFWHYGVPVVDASNPFAGGEWRDLPQGMAGRTLVNGTWDSWTFTPTFNFASFAKYPTPAASPYSPGDFNRDGEVDSNDYGAWRLAFGSTNHTEIDANDSGVVDAADYVVWRMNFAAATGSAAPEPSGAQLALGVLLVLGNPFSRYRKETI